MENTAIPWTRHSGNFWVGCVKVNAACANCYMYRDMPRFGGDPRVVRRTGDANWQKFFKWDREAGEAGEMHSVFVNSWSDFCLPEADPWRADAWEVIRNTPNLRWLILTKRPERIAEFLPPDWGPKGFPNVAWGASVHDQESAAQMLGELLKVRARWLFCSYEPGLGGVVWEPWIWPDCVATREVHDRDHGDGMWCDERSLDWLIVGGESGSIEKARPFEEEWARSAISQCRAAGVPVFIKQMGTAWAHAHGAKDRKGEEPAEWPEDLRVREFPWKEAA